MMKVYLNKNVIKDNVIDGKLQPGNYNVDYEGVMSCVPLYRMFDGEKWERGDFDRDMTVFVREGDYVVDIQGICDELFGDYIKEHFNKVPRLLDYRTVTEYEKILYVKFEDNKLKFSDKRNINFELDNTKLGFPLMHQVKEDLYKVEYHENTNHWDKPEKRLYLKYIRTYGDLTHYKLSISNTISEFVFYTDNHSSHEYNYPVSEGYTHLCRYFRGRGYKLDTYNLQHEKIDTKMELVRSLTFTTRYDIFDGEKCWEGIIDEYPEIKEYGDTREEVENLLWDTVQIIQNKSLDTE
jgi:hypothetical protein